MRPILLRRRAAADLTEEIADESHRYLRLSELRAIGQKALDADPELRAKADRYNASRESQEETIGPEGDHLLSEDRLRELGKVRSQRLGFRI